MTCLNCKEKNHVPQAKYCHVCGAALTTANKRTNTSASQAHSLRFSEVASIVFIISVIAGAALSLLKSRPLSGRGIQFYVDEDSEYNWKYNRRLDPHKYDYILTGGPEPAPVTGFLKVDSTPQGASIYLDGKKTDYVTPATLDGIQEGKHKMTVGMKGKRVRIAWYHKGTGTYSILFNFRENGMPTVLERP